MCRPKRKEKVQKIVSGINPSIIPSSLNRAKTWLERTKDDIKRMIFLKKNEYSTIYLLVFTIVFGWRMASNAKKRKENTKIP